MWEVWSKCKKDPYPGMNNAEARKAITTEVRYNPLPTLSKDFYLFHFRLQIPDGTPNDISSVMSQCWKWKPEERPTFKECVVKLGGTPNKNASTFDADNVVPEEYFNLHK